MSCRRADFRPFLKLNHANKLKRTPESCSQSRCVRVGLLGNRLRLINLFPLESGVSERENSDMSKFGCRYQQTFDAQSGL